VHDSAVTDDGSDRQRRTVVDRGRFDRGRGVLVALHGHGDEPATARSWGRLVAPPGWEVVAPGAPAGPDGVRSWFSTGPRGAVAGEMERSLDRIADLVASLRGDGRPVVVVGFSQGGALALALLRRGRGPLPDAIAVVCGFLAEPDSADPVVGGPSRRPPLLVVAAADDEVVPSFLGEDAAAVLAQEGYDVAVDVVAGGHRVEDPAASRVRGWLADVIGGPMRVSLGLPVDRVDTGAELVSGAAVAELASTWERIGANAAYVTDHPAPDRRWLAAGGHHALEPTVALAFAAAATRTLLLHTHVYVLGYRNPFLAAKALASVDVLSGGRLVLGVAPGYLRPEFDALGADFDRRVERLDEALELLPRIWSGEVIADAGDGWRAREVEVRPSPAHRPHPPMWIGGNSVAAMRRAVRHGQGWAPFPTPDGMERAVRTAAIASVDDLRDRLRRLATIVEEEGRSEPLTVCFTPVSLGGYLADPDAGLAPLVEEVEQLAAMGVDWVSLAVPGLRRAEVAERAEELMQAVRSIPRGARPRS
jgi:probable F420-dependent oxidoreductase